MSELRDLYQQVILDHSKNPHNKGKLGEGAAHAEGHNPLCGDHVEIYAELEGDVIKNVTFEGNGCAISTASASMMTDFLKGKTITETQKYFEDFHHLLTEDKALDDAGESLGKLILFEGVREFPMRVKCATLGWHTLMAAIKNSQESVTTE